MEIAKDAKGGPHFKILTQDNRMFLINEFKNINSLTQNRKMEMMVLMGIIVAAVVLGVIFVFGIIYLNETSKATQQAQVADCANYARAVFNITSTGQPTFIESVTSNIGSTPGG